VDPASQHDRLKVAEEALSWLGTPYHPCADIKGVGVDCAMLLVRVYDACGLGPKGFDPRPYAHDFAMHRSDEHYIQWLGLAGAAQINSPLIGDIALFKFGRCFSHGGIVVDDSGLIVHAYVRHGVIMTRPSEYPLAGRKTQYWSMPYGR
jgi:cell wall-associated NlpC family hydrolase